MKFRCKACDQIIETSADLTDRGHENCDEGDGIWVKLPEVLPIDRDKLRITNLTGLEGKLDCLLDQFNFCYMGNSDAHGYSESEREQYRGWEIALDIPNGGVLAVDLIHPSGLWGRSTDEEFGYYQSGAIREFARAVIDEVERCLVEAPGQLSLFEI